MLAIRADRDIMLAKDLNEAYKIVTKKSGTIFDFYQ